MALSCSQKVYLLAGSYTAGSLAKATLLSKSFVLLTPHLNAYAWHLIWVAVISWLHCFPCLFYSQEFSATHAAKGSYPSTSQGKCIAKYDRERRQGRCLTRFTIYQRGKVVSEQYTQLSFVLTLGQTNGSSWKPMQKQKHRRNKIKIVSFLYSVMWEICTIFCLFEWDAKLYSDYLTRKCESRWYYSWWETGTNKPKPSASCLLWFVCSTEVCLTVF